MDGMGAGSIVAVATPLALGAAWVICSFGDLEELAWVRRVLRWSARTLGVIALLCPPAAAAAFTWVVTQEQDRINETIVEPMLEQFTPTTTTTGAP